MRGTTSIALAALALLGGSSVGGYGRWAPPLPPLPAQSEAARVATITAAEAKRQRKAAARLGGAK